MKVQPRLVHSLLVIVYLLVLSNGPMAREQARDSRDIEMMTLSFGGVKYLHRWSKDGQNEFTPMGDGDLTTWRDMVTVNVHETVTLQMVINSRN